MRWIAAALFLMSMTSCAHAPKKDDSAQSAAVPDRCDDDYCNVGKPTSVASSKK